MISENTDEVRHEDFVAFERQVNSSANILFKRVNPELNEKLRRLTRRLRRECEIILAGQSEELLTVCLAGDVDSFKKELLGAILGPEFKSKDNLADDEGFLWIGNGKPRGSSAKLLRVDSSTMLPLGRPYVLAYSPSRGDFNEASQSVAREAMLSANIKILAVRHESLRDGAQGELLNSIDGSLVLPVIRFDPSTHSSDGIKIRTDLEEESRLEIEKWRKQAVSTTVLPPLFIPELAVLGDREKFDDLVRRGLIDRLESQVSDLVQLEEQRDQQIKACMRQAEKEIKLLLTDFRNRLGESVSHLDRLSEKLQKVMEEDLLGDRVQMFAGLRARFRADALSRTSSLFFPYRSLLGILGLTHGAWDRLIFTSLGSVPSLIMTTLQALQSEKSTRDFEKSLQEQARSRVESLVADACVGDVRNFYNALNAVGFERGDGEAKLNYSRLINIRGITGLKVVGQRHLVKVVERGRVNPVILKAGGWCATLIFWGLLSGPIISLYISYVNTLSDAFLSDRWHEFPAPPASLWLASLLLSLAPVFVVAMIVMHLACSSKRVAKSRDELTEKITEEIQARSENGQLVVELNDDKLDAARYLLTLSK